MPMCYTALIYNIKCVIYARKRWNNVIFSAKFFLRRRSITVFAGRSIIYVPRPHFGWQTVSHPRYSCTCVYTPIICVCTLPSVADTGSWVRAIVWKIVKRLTVMMYHDRFPKNVQEKKKIGLDQLRSGSSFCARGTRVRIIIITLRTVNTIFYLKLLLHYYNIVIISILINLLLRYTRVENRKSFLKYFVASCIIICAKPVRGYRPSVDRRARGMHTRLR